MTRLELGTVMADGTYLCDGCNVQEPFEHRCHGSDGEWADGRSCQCRECEDTTSPVLTEEEMARLVRQSSRDRVLSLAWGPAGAAVVPSGSTRWALRLLHDWRQDDGDGGEGLGAD